MRLSGDTQASGERPHTFLEFNSCGNAVVGLDLGATKLFGTVANLGGEFLHERSIPWLEQKPVNCVEQMCDLIHGLFEAPRPPQQKIRAIAVGAQVVILFPQGVVTWAPSLGWRDLPLRDVLSERFGLPL